MHSAARRRLFGLALAALACLPGAALAGLYPKAAPPGSAYVRVFNATATPASAKIGDQVIPEVPAFDGSAFVFLPAGSYPLQIGENTQTGKLDADHYYTAVSESGAIHLFDQNRFDSQLKALVSVFNLIDGAPLSLRTADGKVTVIDAIASKALGQREVNPVKITFGLFAGDNKVVDAKPLIMERGQTYSLIVSGTTAQPIVVWLK